MTFPAILRGACLALALMFSFGNADATGIIPLSGTQQFDKDTSPPAFLNGGIVNIYLATTTTPAPIFSDFALTVPLANPLTLNAAGRFPAVYVADGLYRVRVSNSASVLQFDDDSMAAVTAAVSATPVTVVASQLWSTGDVKVRYDDQPADGFVRANGRTIGSATSGASERANADCEALFKFLWGFANVALPAGRGASAAADWSANKVLNLPDMAGRLIGARSDLGNGVKTTITAATVSGPTLAGATGGVEVVTLDATMIPPHVHPSPALTDPGHVHPDPIQAVNETISIGSTSMMLPGGNTNTGSSVTGITIAANTGSAGGGAAHNNMPPVMLFTTYLKLHHMSDEDMAEMIGETGNDNFVLSLAGAI